MSKRHYVAWFDFAFVQAALGQRNQAINRWSALTKIVTRI